MTIDTLAFAKHLERAGIDRKFAEAHAEAMNQHLVPQLATKADVEHAVIELKSEYTKGVSDLRSDLSKGLSDLRREISELSTRISETNKAMSELTVRMMLAMLATAGLAITIAKIIL